MVAYNQSLSLPEALRRCRALDGFSLAWIEEPVHRDDDAGHARIASEIATPIQLGENWVGARAMTRAIAAGAGDLAMLDVMKIGGVTGWMRAASLAEADGRPVSSHVFQEISAHLLCVTPGADWLEYLPKADAVLASPLAVVDGLAQPSIEPGNGIAWNEAAVDEYCGAS
jgi:mandelate racemase